MREEIVANEEYPDLVSVRSVCVRDSSVVYVTFSDGSTRDIDLEPYLHGPLFDPIRLDPQLFAQVVVDPETETLTWPNGADIDPDVLYYDGDPPWSRAEDAENGVSYKLASSANQRQNVGS
ncbi:MAG: DUF2442 domain-containing protein [Anaerolineae bacterium]